MGVNYFRWWNYGGGLLDGLMMFLGAERGLVILRDIYGKQNKA